MTSHQISGSCLYREEIENLLSSSDFQCVPDMVWILRLMFSAASQLVIGAGDGREPVSLGIMARWGDG